jgi:dUTP pyrophosphatase
VTSSAKIAKTGFSFALDFLPRSPIASRIWPSTAEGETPAEYEPETTAFAINGSDPLSPAPEAPAATEALPETEVAPTESTNRLGAMEELRIIKLSDKATLPTRGHDNDAGLDLYAAEAALITPGVRVSIGTGLAVAIPEGLAGLVLPRSGLALKSGVTLVNSPGLIDPGYRGEVRVVLINTDPNTDFHCKPGDRIAQLLLVPIATASPMQADGLDTSDRGGAGFGSTGR